MWILLLVVSLLPGCGSGFGAARTASTITTESTHTPASLPGARIIFAGPDSLVDVGLEPHAADTDAQQIVEDTAGRWLQHRGFTILDQHIRAHLIHEQTFHLSNEDRIRVGKLMGADVVVVRTVSRPLATVTLKGVSVETGEVLWSGSASTTPNGDPSTLHTARRELDMWRGIGWGYPTRADWNQLASTPVIQALTCQALATAFHLQSPGTRQLDFDRACDLR